MKRDKIDAVDAEAICEAVRRPTVRFGSIKSAEQEVTLSLHRARNMLVKQRTQLVNMIRGPLAEFGTDLPEDVERALGLARQIAAKEATLEVPALAMQFLGLLSEQVLFMPASRSSIVRFLSCKERMT